ncbi:TetR/AcrR family transcriptional regulator [Leucobacter sp. HY1910]
MTDARIVRTRASLRAAILDLASQKPVTEITVSELAAAAEINRVTFYKHYASPAEALREALTSELDRSREAFLARFEEPTSDVRFDLISGVNFVLDHIDEHRKLYELSFADPDDGAVPSVLSAHFSDTIRLHLADYVPKNSASPEFDPEVIACYCGAGLVGALHMWVREGKCDREVLLKSLTALIPTWWFGEED